MIANWTAVLSIAAFFIGQLLVTRRHWMGFLVWGISNYTVAAVFALQANAATTCMFLVYFAANMRSMLTWSRQSKPNSAAAPAR